jgi:hypothetical protein
MNSDLINDRSIAFATRVEKEFDTLKMRVKRIVQLALGRVPVPQEWNHLEKYVEKMIKYHESHDPKKNTYPTSITRSLVEEATGMPFEYEEILPVFKDYKSDTKADQVNPQTRALADLCLVLFNSNEFIYVY